MQVLSRSFEMNQILVTLSPAILHRPSPAERIARVSPAKALAAQRTAFGSPVALVLRSVGRVDMAVVPLGSLAPDRAVALDNLAEHKSAALVDNLAALVDNLAAAVRKPAAAVGKPVAVVRKPAAVVRKPAAVVRKPGAVVRKPAAVVRKPGAVVRKPVVVVRKPAAAGDSLVVAPDKLAAAADRPVLQGPLVLSACRVRTHC